MSNFIIHTNFITSEKCEEFCTQFQALLSSLGLECKEYSADHDNHYRFVSEPMLAATDEPVAEPITVPEPQPEVPPMEISVELPAEPPIQAELPPDVTVDLPTDLPTPDVSMPASVEQLGDCTILSLSMTHSIPVIRDTTGTSKLMVGSSGMNDGKLNFWYGGIQFFMPSIDDSMKFGVKNPDHQVQPNTLRVLVSFNGEQFPLLVDVEESSDKATECLVLGFAG